MIYFINAYRTHQYRLPKNQTKALPKNVMNKVYYITVDFSSEAKARYLAHMLNNKHGLGANYSVIREEINGFDWFRYIASIQLLNLNQALWLFQEMEKQYNVVTLSVGEEIWVKG